MRFFYIFSCISAISAFNLFPDIFQRNKRQDCKVYTIIQYPCVVQTWVPSNTVLWIDTCSTTLNVSNAPTSLTTTITSTTTVGVASTSTSTTTVVLQLQTTSTLSTTLTLPGSVQGTPVVTTSPIVSGANTASGTVSTVNPVATGCIPSSITYPKYMHPAPSFTMWMLTRLVLAIFL
jgi:hypothetical protein